tara:strand:- start:543 stop:995 length:453 start_codon:yes stop_codon:yes gene_type:complete
MYDAFQGGEKLDNLPDFVSSRETLTSNPKLADDFPLNLISPKSHGFLNSCYANMEQKVKSQGAQSLLINEVDAAVRKINEGDKVKVFNKRGSYLALAALTEDIPAGVVLTTLGYWDQLNKGVANHTSSQEFSDIGHAPSYSDNLVEVKRL